MSLLLSRVVGKVDLERRAQLHASDTDTGALQLAQCRGGILVLDGEVAAVETELHVLLQLALSLIGIDAERRRQHPGSRVEQPVAKERHRLRRVLENAIRLRLDVEMDDLAVLAPDFYERLDDAHDVARDCFPCRRIRDIHPRFVGERRRRDAAVHSCGHERLEDANQIEGVLDPRIVAPVRRVDARLDRRAVEVAVGEAIDHGDVQAVVIQEFPELQQPVAAQQLPRLARRESQTNTERRVGREARFERRRVPVEDWRARPPSRRRRGCSCSKSGGRGE